MNYKKILIVGTEIAVAAVAGLITFVGAKQVFSEDNKKELKNRAVKPSLRNCPRTPDGDIPEDVLDMKNTNPMDVKKKLLKEASDLSSNEVAPPSTGVAVVHGLKKAQGVVEKVIALVSSLTTVVESTVRIFDKKSDNYLGPSGNRQVYQPNYDTGGNYGFYNTAPRSPQVANSYNDGGYGGYTSFNNQGGVVRSNAIPETRFDGDPYGYGTPGNPGPLSNEASENVMMRIPIGETVRFNDGTRVRRSDVNVFEFLP